MKASKRTLLVANACKEVDKRFRILLGKGIHSYSKIAMEKKESLIQETAKKFGITEQSIKIVINS